MRQAVTASARSSWCYGPHFHVSFPVLVISMFGFIILNVVTVSIYLQIVLPFCLLPCNFVHIDNTKVFN